MNTKINQLVKDNTKKDKELSELKHEIDTLQTNLEKEKETVAAKSLDIHNLQFDLSSVKSELSLVQHENEQTSQQLSETQLKLDNTRSSLKDANEINTYKAKL